MALRRRLWSSLLVLASAAALCGSLVLSAEAGAATIHACVKKASGVTRIVSAKTKCKHGEQALSWNTVGPKGAPGAPGASGAAGASGAPGANGAVAGFVASKPTEVPFEEGSTVIVSKLLPPGSYIISAKTELEAASNKSETVGAECAMFDAPGTTPPLSGSSVDAEVWAALLTKLSAGTEFGAVGYLPFLGSVSSTVATTVDLICGRLGTVSVGAYFTQLAATQVSSIG